MKIQVLYFDDCPNYQQTVDLVARAIDDLGVSGSLELVKVETPESAVENRFLGSPTVLVNGVDIDPAAQTRTDYGLSCRRYGAVGVPPHEMIVTALKHRSGGVH